jgi:hypothetical protein
MMLDGYTGQEHALPVVPLYKDVVQLVAQSGLYYTPTLLYTHGGPMAYEYFYSKYDVHGDPKVRRFMPHAEVDARSRSGERFADDAYPFPKIAKVAADIVASGGKVGLGGHSMLTGLGSHWELWALQSGGMPTYAALRAATLTGAEALGVAQDLGSLEVGKLADLVVLNENPLADIHNSNTIRYVLKNGEMFDGRTLDQQWPLHRALPKQSWWELDVSRVAP